MKAIHLWSSLYSKLLKKLDKPQQNFQGLSLFSKQIFIQIFKSLVTSPFNQYFSAINTLENCQEEAIRNLEIQIKINSMKCLSLIVKGFSTLPSDEHKEQLKAEIHNVFTEIYPIAIQLSGKVNDDSFLASNFLMEIFNFINKIAMRPRAFQMIFNNNSKEFSFFLRLGSSLIYFYLVFLLMKKKLRSIWIFLMNLSIFLRIYVRNKFFSLFNSEFHFIKDFLC